MGGRKRTLEAISFEVVMTVIALIALILIIAPSLVVLIVSFTSGFSLKFPPPGYSLLITHPVNRHDLPFTTLTGLVDTDRYKDNFINFPARWRDPAFNGVLAKGTPIAQCVPVKRAIWSGAFEAISGDAIGRLQETAASVTNERGVYRRQFRAPKH